jgi:hypothetical protein
MTRVAFQQLATEYPVMVDRYCSDDGREDRQSVMMMSCAVWAREEGFDVDLFWDVDPEIDVKGLKAVFITLFSAAAYRLKHTIDKYKSAAADCRVIVCGPHAISFPDHCYRSGADAVVGRCDRELLVEMLKDIRQGSLKRFYHTQKPIHSFPHQRVFRELGLIPRQSFMNVVTSTGCPYTCEFCTDATTDYAPISSHDALLNIQSSDEPIIVFNDPTFGVGRQGRALLQELCKLDERYFMAFTTNSMIRDATFRTLLSQSGFVLVEIGLENINSKFAKNKNADFLEIFSQCDFLILVNYIWGYDERDLDDNTANFLYDLSRQSPNVFPMVFVPFSLPETAQHHAHLAEGKIFDPSYLCIGNEILSMRVAGATSPRDYYRRLSALNETLYEGHADRMRSWISGNPRIGAQRKQVMLSLVERRERQDEILHQWEAILDQVAPDSYTTFAQEVLRRAVPGFERYELAL